MNHGYTGIEIAEMMEMPPALEAAWHTHGYYGSVSHNVKAIYQRYLGWFDGNPSSLWEHPPVESARRYVDCMGGVEQVVAKAREYADNGDLRFAAQLLKHAVFADHSHQYAKNTLAEVYEKLGFGSENGTWRNFYLQGAAELRTNETGDIVALASPDMVAALSVDQLIDSVAIRLNGPKCWNDSFAIDWVFTDLGHTYRTALSNGVLIQGVDPTTGESELTVTLTKQEFIALLTGATTVDTVSTSGEPSLAARLVSYLDEPTPKFPIVTR
jgi:alkyl sulfatase BDS1-like metallo-beta-lactamase superfamily hydrolase